MINNGKLIFLGTGSSDGVPRVSCLTDPNSTCKVCIDAQDPNSKNRRRNTSVAIKSIDKNGLNRNIIIDAGKTFWESAIKFFPKHDIREISEMIITHAHADAIGGIDYLRDWTNFVQKTVKINLRSQDLESIEKVYFYLFEDGKVKTKGPIPKIQFNIIDENPFNIGDLEITPIPVFHGNQYISFGYKFGKIAYISDVSEIPESSKNMLKDLDVLIIDALRPEPAYFSHFTYNQALEVIREFKPKKSFFTDIMCSVDHNETNNELSKLLNTEGLDIQLAYDGMIIDFNY
ncbi:MAG: MBL fold metallo-hydrolase [Chloroflexota bacterium]|nr:MBL fold metallo-hydrolase [Chloroflexota bacterium]